MNTDMLKLYSKDVNLSEGILGVKTNKFAENYLNPMCH